MLMSANEKSEKQGPEFSLGQAIIKSPLMLGKNGKKTWITGVL